MTWLADHSKAELHVHLEGAVGPELLQSWEPNLTRAEIAAFYRPRNFAEFIESYRFVCRKLDGPTHYVQAVRHLVDQLEAQGVRYAEVTLSAGVVLWRGMDLAAVYDAIWMESQAQSNRVRLRWVLDAIRHMGVDAAWPVVEFAASRRSQGVVAFGIGGDELRGPVRQFVEVFRYATEHGLKLVPHAGETDGPDSIWGALEGGAARLGHGIRAVDDPMLMSHLRNREIPLEVCITSNVRLGLVAAPAVHPVRQLYDAGVPITLNTDDPALFGTTLLNEYELAERELGFTVEELRELAANAWRFSFDSGYQAAAAGDDPYGRATGGQVPLK